MNETGSLVVFGKKSVKLLLDRLVVIRVLVLHLSTNQVVYFCGREEISLLLTSSYTYYLDGYINFYKIMALFLTLVALVLMIERKWATYRNKKREKSNETKSNRTSAMNETLLQNSESREEKKEKVRRQFNQILRKKVQKFHY